MTQKEQTETEIKMEIEKKMYTPPTIKVIGEVRDITHGGGSTTNADSTTFWDHYPSDPNIP